MWRTMIAWMLMIQMSFAHEHGLSDRKDFKYQDSWTVKLLRHLTGFVHKIVQRS